MTTNSIPTFDRMTELKRLSDFKLGTTTHVALNSVKGRYWNDNELIEYAIANDRFLYCGRNINWNTHAHPLTKPLIIDSYWRNHNSKNKRMTQEGLCELFRHDLIYEKHTDLDRLKEIDGMALACWCRRNAPYHCHCQTLIEIRELQKQGLPLTMFPSKGM